MKRLIIIRKRTEAVAAHNGKFSRSPTLLGVCCERWLYGNHKLPIFLVYWPRSILSFRGTADTLGEHEDDNDTDVDGSTGGDDIILARYAFAPIISECSNLPRNSMLKIMMCSTQCLHVLSQVIQELVSFADPCATVY